MNRSRAGLVGVAGLALGLCIGAWVLWDTDWMGVVAAVSAVGTGFVVICAARFAPLACDAMGWRALVRPALAGPIMATRLRWIGESVNTLLPVAQVGGDVVRARLMGKCDGRMLDSAAATASDFAVGLVAQAAFTVTALMLFVVGLGATGLERQAAIGAAVAVGIGVFVVVLLRSGVFGRLAGAARTALPDGLAEKLGGGAHALDSRITNVMTDRPAMTMGFVWRFVGWFVRSSEPWLILWFAGSPVSFFAALVIEAVANAVRSAAFFVPGAIGVQEGGIIAVGIALGLDVETAVALALVKRGREVCVSLPGLVDWWGLERGFARRAA